MEDAAQAEGKGAGVTVGRAGLGGEIQKVKENPGSGGRFTGGTVQGRLEELGSLTGECAGEAGGDGLSPVLRVGSSPRGHRGQRGDRGDPGQGPALGLLAARGIGPGL